MSSSEVAASTKTFEFKPGKLVTISALKHMLPDVETALFFGKVYELDYRQLSDLLYQVFGGRKSVVDMLCAGDHSLDLQDYLIDVIPDDIETGDRSITFDPTAVAPAQVLPQLWESLEIEVAASIKAVAEKLADTVGMLPGKQGAMVFGHMAKLNKQRPTIGTYQAGIKHARQVENLVILDVSGSMTSTTVQAIIDDVVSLAYMANAHLAIVSNNAYHWEPGTYTVDEVLKKSEFGGTNYEQLMPLLHQCWGTVITIADYDSSYNVKSIVRDQARGSIDTVLDISLVNQPTYLSQCVGQIAREVRPIMVGSSQYIPY